MSDSRQPLNGTGVARRSGEMCISIPRGGVYGNNLGRRSLVLPGLSSTRTNARYGSSWRSVSMLHYLPKSLFASTLNVYTTMLSINGLLDLLSEP